MYQCKLLDKKPHTIAKELILQCAKDINRILIGKEAENKLNIPSLSDNAVQRRILLMDENKDQVIDLSKSARLFALQLEESIDVLFCAELIAFVLYIHNGEFKDHFLCIINLRQEHVEKIFIQLLILFSRRMTSSENRCLDSVEMVLQP